MITATALLRIDWLAVLIFRVSLHATWDIRIMSLVASETIRQLALKLPHYLCSEEIMVNYLVFFKMVVLLFCQCYLSDLIGITSLLFLYCIYTIYNAVFKICRPLVWTCGVSTTRGGSSLRVHILEVRLRKNLPRPENIFLFCHSYDSWNKRKK